MKQKEIPKEVFANYGLTDEEIAIYLTFMEQQQATTADVAVTLGLDYKVVAAVVSKLEQIKFLRKASGIVERFIPTEPFLEMFIAEGKRFREQVAKIKSSAMADQSKQYTRLDGIKEKNTGEVDNAVDTQVKAFFKDSDQHDADKKGVIDGANSRFSSTAQQLEKDLHSTVDERFTEVKTDVEQMRDDAAKVWDDNAAKFNGDNDTLNKELAEITAKHVDQTNALEANLHKMLDDLNAKVQEISAGFVSKFEGGITEGKAKINQIVDGMLADFKGRVQKLEVELKKDLDNYVEWHKDNTNSLTPKLQEILEKYLTRMNQVVEKFKNDFSRMLLEHQDQLKTRTNQLATNLKERVGQRHKELSDQVKNFETNTVTLIDNLKDIADKLSDLSNILASRGSAWKALFLSKHKDYVALKEEVTERISGLAGEMKDLFIASTSTYIKETGATSTALQGEIDTKTSEQYAILKKESETLDRKAQETVNAELEGLAGDLSGEIDKTLRANIEKARDTTTKLKDSLENSLHTHHDDYNKAIEVHRKNSLTHFSDCDADTKAKNTQYLADLDGEFTRVKGDATTEKTTQNKDVQDFLKKEQDKNNTHSKTFNKDTADTKTKQAGIYKDRLAKVRSDWDTAKANVTEKITGETTLFNKECTDTDAKLHAMLEDHKGKYKENATNLQQQLNTMVADNVQSIKDTIADFTLQFMNTLDETRDVSEKSEEKLTQVLNASLAYIEQAPVSTWHVIGTQAIIHHFQAAMDHVKSTVVIVTPTVVPEVLEKLSEIAYRKKAARFMYTTSWDLQTYNDIINKMKTFGNIQFRQLKGKGDYWAVTRDAEEVILAPAGDKEEAIIGIVSTDPGYSSLYSQFIGPVFLANSRPI